MHSLTLLVFFDSIHVTMLVLKLSRKHLFWLEIHLVLNFSSKSLGYSWLLLYWLHCRLKFNVVPAFKLTESLKYILELIKNLFLDTGLNCDVVSLWTTLIVSNQVFTSFCWENVCLVHIDYINFKIFCLSELDHLAFQGRNEEWVLSSSFKFPRIVLMSSW